MITDNFSDPKRKFICGAWFSKSASPLMRRGARLSMKLCQFALRHGQPMRWRVIEGIEEIEEIEEIISGEGLLNKIMHPVMR